MPFESPRIPLPPGQSGPSLELLELDDDEELLLDDELELLLELLEPELDDPLELDPELDEPEPEEELLPEDELDELLELDEEELLDELLEESSLSGTPPLVNMMTALKYPRYPGSENCIMPILPSP